MTMDTSSWSASSSWPSSLYLKNMVFSMAIGCIGNGHSVVNVRSWWGSHFWPKKTLTLEFLRFRSASSEFCNFRRPEKLLALYWVLSAYLQAWTHMQMQIYATHTHIIHDGCIPHLWPQNISMNYKIWIRSPIFLRHSPLCAGPTSSGEWGLVGGGRLPGR